MHNPGCKHMSLDHILVYGLRFCPIDINTNAMPGSVPQQKFRSLTVAARFPVHDKVNTNARKPSRDRQEAEQFYWHLLKLFL
ncbi:hypothetical protein Lsha_0502 [Legionella shakespearei DSM 23087]|uniref:Uncharacterized protein n=1 Tax=Legionella shakespearei DSM 23087 TaxID=1122169 RepID=A0A0W0Z7N5_9GAMM|nr:hypothetical protein Lsha_0502 [Legionella shakespearei DSM 23087]